MAAKGYFVYYKTPTGFSYRLQANNKETIAVNGGGAYANLSACKKGIESVKKLAEQKINEKIEDQTLKEVVTLTNPKCEVYVDKQGKFRWRLRASNAQLLCISEEGYASKASCKSGLASVMRWALESEVVSEDELKA